MAHFAKLDSNLFVLCVVCIDDADAPTEGAGVEWLRTRSNGHLHWKQCSYNGSFRKNFPSKGYRYDPDADAFVAPKPMSSWVLNDNCEWVPPVQPPTGEGRYVWDESILEWRSF